MRGGGWWWGLMLLLVFAGGQGCGDESSPPAVDGAWRRHTIDDRFRGADGVRVADVNGDGWLDVATGWEESGVTRAYLHPGNAGVREAWPAVTVGMTPNVEDAVWADIDADGRMDVVSSAEGRTRAVFVSFAPADPRDFLAADAWQTERVPAAAGRQWMYALPLQLDGDHGVDLVVGSKGRNAVVAWLEAPADARDMAAWQLHEISSAGWVMSIDAVDMNDDGHEDLLISDRERVTTRGVRWLANPGLDRARLASPWANHVVGADDRRPVIIELIMLADATPEAIVVPAARRRLSLFERILEGPDSWRESSLTYPRDAGDPKAVAAGDIDLDGRLDVVLTCTNLRGRREGVMWLSNATMASDFDSETHTISGPEGKKFDRVELIDLDGDGDLDVLTTEEVAQLGVIWYENPARDGDE